MTALATWLVNTLGKAIAISMVVAFGFGVLAALTGEPAALFGAALFCPLVFAGVLYSASAPLPPMDG